MFQALQYGFPLPDVGSIKSWPSPACAFAGVGYDAAVTTAATRRELDSEVLLAALEKFSVNEILGSGGPN